MQKAECLNADVVATMLEASKGSLLVLWGVMFRLCRLIPLRERKELTNHHQIEFPATQLSTVVSHPLIVVS